MLIYLGLSALSCFALALALLLFAEPSLLAAIHLVLALAIMPLIFGAIAHFVPVLTRSGGAPRAMMGALLLLQSAGVLAVLHFYGVLGLPALHAAAGGALAVCLGFIYWLIVRAKCALGTPHPGWRWYLAALAFLAAGLALVPALSYWPAYRPALRLLHVHFNLLGFIGLTAIGTLQVLLPTVLGGPDAEATRRLRSDLPAAVAGVLAIAFGTVFGWPLAVIGTGLLLYVAGRLGWAWVSRFGWRSIIDNGASASLAGALCGFLLLLILGFAHGLGGLSGHDAVLAFVVSFLLPLVTGALPQLLPVWRYPGRQTPARETLRARLIQGGALRAGLFLGGGVLLAFGQSAGLAIAALGLLHFALQCLRGLAWSAFSQSGQ